MKHRLDFILLNGAMGSGKSTIAELLKKKLKRTAVLEIEDIRQLICDVEKGKEDNALAWKIIYRMCDEYFKNGVSVLLKQTVASQEMVNKFLQLAKKYKCTIGFYHLQASRKTLLKRLQKRGKAKKVSRSLIINSITKHKKIKYANAIIIDTSIMKPGESTAFILDHLGRYLEDWGTGRSRFLAAKVKKARSQAKLYSSSEIKRLIGI